MRLLLFRSLWTNGFDLSAALADCATGEFNGVEGPVPEAAGARREFWARLRDAGVPFIAEIATGRGYVPQDESPAGHLEDFRRQAGAALEGAPLFLTSLAGCDSWPRAQSVDFFGRAMAIAVGLGVRVAFETHRSRPTFNPWATREILQQLPAMRITCDFSHWCCVCERLVVDDEPQVLELCAERADHIHARVGYAQGPQVPHPEAPEYGPELTAHERWWRVILFARARAGCEVSTATPEFGPDGYLQTPAFTTAPVAKLDEINRWMARRQRARFARGEAAIRDLFSRREA
jgi:hypothetical protein